MPLRETMARRAIADAFGAAASQHGLDPGLRVLLYLYAAGVGTRVMGSALSPPARKVLARAGLGDHDQMD